MSKFHYIATNRRIITDENGKEFIDTSGVHFPSAAIRFASYNNETKEVKVLPDVTGKINYQSDKKEGSLEVFYNIYKRMAENKTKDSNDLLIYVHGFANHSEDLEVHIDFLHNKFVKSPESPIKEILIFFWTTNGKATPWDYYSDQKDAIVAGLALSRLFLKLDQFYKEFFKVNWDRRKLENELCGNNLHLICHSMGNRVLKNMLDTLIESDSLTRNIQELILIAPDTDNDLFEEQNSFSYLTDIAERVHVYINKNDKILRKISNRINKKKRLGLGPLKTVTTDNVFFVDVSEVLIENEAKYGQHWYHETVDFVTQDINEVLRQVNVDTISNREYRVKDNTYVLANSCPHKDEKVDPKTPRKRG